MFRLLVLISLMLAGCKNKTVSEPHIITLPKPGYVCCENGGGQKMFKQSVWTKKTHDFEIFNQKAQRLILETFETARWEDKSDYYIKKGNKLYSSLTSPVFRKKEETLLLSIHKLGPDTTEDFIKGFLNWTQDMGKTCKLIEIYPGAWQIYPVPGEGFEYFHNQPASDFCTLHSNDHHKPGTVFLVKQGIVVVYFNSAFWGGIDLNSITYENRG